MFFCVASLATAQPRFPDLDNPCDPLPGAGGTPLPNAVMTIYDPLQGVCWLADANLAANPDMRAKLAVTGVSPNGAMDYATAQKWVAALNAWNNGLGYGGHNTWQLPVAPLKDSTCADIGSQGGSFGPQCTGSAFGHLYYDGLLQTFPNSIASGFGATIAPIHNLKLSYYWALQNNGGTGSGAGGGGQEVFSFANGLQGGTTTKDSYYYVLPVVTVALASPPSCTGGAAVTPYTTGPAAGKAVLDCATGYTWPADANLAATESFGVTGNTAIVYATRTITAPMIDSGSMLFQTAQQWIAAMNKSQYLGSSAWQLPASSKDFETLFADLNLASGDGRMMSAANAGPFQNLQPFFYWACERDQSGNSQSACTGYAPPDGSTPLQWSFDFNYGFQSTSALVQKYFVMVYYPASAPPVQPCTGPAPCCAHTGGLWGGGYCR